uniref:Uncharacterized protein n=1 Tax=Haptolina ericina TaxID=156174 RepID=A0A7S3F2R0_9EUKA
MYAALAVMFAAYLGSTMMREPLFPFQMSSASWSSSWLLTTVADYYVSTFCLCGIIIASEPPVAAALWSIGCCLGGSPFCCAFVISRIYKHRTLRLCDSKYYVAAD